MARVKFTIVALACALGMAAAAMAQQQQLVAFPGAEGFGKYSEGGRGGQVVYVTSLMDDSVGAIPGTLRWAVQQYPGEPLTVCFAVSGEIRLKKDLRINRDHYTLAGQTAPGMGIVITHNKMNLGGSSHFIVRNLRFRVGSEDINGNFIAQNAVGAENCHHYIFDHCDFGWSTEENMNSYDSHFITIQYCIVHEGLCNSGHPKGARGYGCQWGGSPATYHHNLLVNNDKRSCRFNGGSKNDRIVYLDYINNVVYNYGAGSNGCYGGENTAEGIGEYNGLNAAHEVNFINNYYKPGPNTTNSTKLFVRPDYARSGMTSWGPSQWYINGNIMEGVASANTDNWNAVQVQTYSKDTCRVDTLIRPVLNYYQWVDEDSVLGRYDFDDLAYAAAEFETAEDAYNTVLDTVGCWPRDHVELRLISDTRNTTYTYTGSKSKKKGIIDLPTDAEGFYAYPDVTAPVDTDQDGMPDEWETANGTNPQMADQNTLHTSGYTMLEMYLDYAMQHRPMMEDHYGEPQAFNQPSDATATKRVQNGFVLIERGEHTYTVMGNEK